MLDKLATIYKNGTLPSESEYKAAKYQPVPYRALKRKYGSWSLLQTRFANHKVAAPVVEKVQSKPKVELNVKE